MKKQTIIIMVIILLAIMSGMRLFAQAHKATDIVGVWFNDIKSSKVQIFSEGGKFYGKIVWLRETTDKVTGKPRTDDLNQDPKLRTTPLLSLLLMKSFVFDGKDEWKDGTVYDPKNGKTYSAYLKLESSGQLKLRGYIGISLLGRTSYWTKTQ